jgi:hypothetical protein
MVKNSKFIDNVQVWYGTTKRSCFINTEKRTEKWKIIFASCGLPTRFIIKIEHQIKSKREWNYQLLD